MNVLWSFVGSSEGHIIFSGIGELLADLLLCFRRTATLGALVATGVLTNIVALNFPYDVPVKLSSSHLLLLSLGLCAPDCLRLLKLLVLNRPTSARDLSRPRLPDFGHALKLLVVGSTTSTSIIFGYKNYNSSQMRPALFGIWDTESYELDGELVAPLTTDPQRW